MDKKLKEMRANRPYEIGYGKPPVQAQFVKGRSGNPKDRPKKKEAQKRAAKPAPMEVETRDLVLRFADRLVAARGGEGDIKVTAEEAVLHSLLSAAVKGNSNAQKSFLDRVERFRAALAGEIAADHEFWRSYIENYPKRVEAVRRAGNEVPEHWMHPHDLVFPEKQHVMLRGGADAGEAKRNHDYIMGFREAALLQSVYDERCFDGPLNELPLFLSSVIAAWANMSLPKRIQLDNSQYLLQYLSYSALKKRELTRRLKEAWISLGHPESVGVTTAPLRADAPARIRDF